jgi:DNA polymerase IV
MKIMCVLLPHFPVCCEVRRQPDMAGCPAIVLYAAGSQKLVMDYSPELDGLEHDMPLQQAISRHGQAMLLQADLPYYWSLFNEVLDRLETKSPLVEGFALGQAYLGLTGLQLIYPDDAVLVNSVKEAVPTGFTVQIGIAEGKFPAYLAALRSPAGGCQSLSGNLPDFLQDLPCDTLPVSLKSKDKLREFGIRTLGQASALPPGPLRSQFGPEGDRIVNLSRGDDGTPLYPRFMAENIEESKALSSVTVSLESILVTLEELLARVFTRDSLQGRGIRRLTVWTRGWSAEHWEHTISYKEAAMDIKSVIARIKPLFETYAQPGPVEQVGLRITGLGYRSGRQKSLFSEVRARDRLIDDIKQLDFRLGGPQVFKIKDVEPWSRIPERRSVLTPISQ